MKRRVDVAVIGGSGFYELLEKPIKIDVSTPFGKTSDKISLGKIGDATVAFIPRHGKKHQYPPHLVPYKANIYALKSLGVKKIIAPSASGSLKKHIQPGDFVLSDQYINFTFGREDTFFTGKSTLKSLSHQIVHISQHQPYCPSLRRVAYSAAIVNRIRIHKTGTMVVINGPRFATSAESAYYQKNGWHIINMTQYPEVVLAREAEICYLNISLITDYDNCVFEKFKIKPVSASLVLETFKENTSKLKSLIKYMLTNKRDELLSVCTCNNSLVNAVLN